MELVLFIIAIAALIIALFFAFTNGFHDASSTVATMIACGAATPGTAVVLSAAWGFAGAMLGGTAVALTMLSLLTVPLGTEMVYVIFAAVTSASIWNLVTWKYGIPSSSTHALVGGLIGGAVAASGLSDVNWGLNQLIDHGQLEGITKVVAFLFISVIVGFVLGYIMLRLTKFLLRNAKKNANKDLKRSQFLLSGLLSFSHGANDAQKVMGLMVLVIASVGWAPDTTIPLWVMLACAIAMTIGAIGGGWKIIKTLARRIFRIKPIHSFDSLISSISAVLGSTLLGAPVSSTHVVATSIMGVGAAENAKMVQWSIGREMVYSWLLTIPVAAIISGVIYLIARGI